MEHHGGADKKHAIQPYPGIHFALSASKVCEHDTAEGVVSEIHLEDVEFVGTGGTSVLSFPQNIHLRDRSLKTAEKLTYSIFLMYDPKTATVFESKRRLSSNTTRGPPSRYIIPQILAALKRQRSLHTVSSSCMTGPKDHN
jgi:hypothetical protein